MSNRRVESTPSLADSLATEASKGATHKSQFNSRLDRYGRAKNLALATAQYIRQNEPDHRRLSHNIEECGSYLVFKNYFTVGEVRLSGARFCKKHLLCPLCAIRRGAKVLSRYLDRFEANVAENASLKPYMVTLTVKDGPDLQERFNHLQKSLVTWHKRRHRTKGSCEARKAHGAAWSYEIKRGKNSGSWHPHVHAVWLCETPPSQMAISEEWHKITGDSFIVDVRPINQADPAAGFMEVFKYAVKFSEQTTEDTWHSYLTLQGKRLIGSFGNLYGVPEPDELADDPLEGLPYFEMFFMHSRTAGYFPVSSDLMTREEITS